MGETVLYFGSYNPVHRGHIAIAQYVAQQGFGDVWMVVSPQNPLKPSGDLAADANRLRMVEIAVENAGNSAIEASGIEFGLPKPSYTIDTLRELVRRYPERHFSLLVGSDIPNELDRWKEYGAILDGYRILVYPRPGVPVERFANRVTLLDGAPAYTWSSTEIRQRLNQGLDCSAMLDTKVYDYIKKHGLWDTIK